MNKIYRPTCVPIFIYTTFSIIQFSPINIIYAWQQHLLDLTKTSIEICVTAAAAAATPKLIFRAISLKCTRLYGIGSFMPIVIFKSINYCLSRTITSLIWQQKYIDSFLIIIIFLCRDDTLKIFVCVCMRASLIERRVKR